VTVALFCTDHETSHHAADPAGSASDDDTAVLVRASNSSVVVESLPLLDTSLALLVDQSADQNRFNIDADNLLRKRNRSSISLPFLLHLNVLETHLRGAFYLSFIYFVYFLINSLI